MSEDLSRLGTTQDVASLLGVYESDRARDARVRERCHAALEKRRRQNRVRVRPGWRRAFEPAVVGALCAVYLLEVLSRAFRLYEF
jgi:hypothetical protein